MNNDDKRDELGHSTEQTTERHYSGSTTTSGAGGDTDAATHEEHPTDES